MGHPGIFSPRHSGMELHTNDGFQWGGGTKADSEWRLLCKTLFRNILDIFIIYIYLYIHTHYNKCVFEIAHPQWVETQGTRSGYFISAEKMQKSKGRVAEKGMGLKKPKFVRQEFTHTVRHCPRALLPTGMGVMGHTVRDEAGRRRGGQRKCTIQITIRVQLYIPGGPAALPAERGSWGRLGLLTRLYHFPNCVAPQKIQTRRNGLVWNEGFLSIGELFYFLMSG